MLHLGVNMGVMHAHEHTRIAIVCTCCGHPNKQERTPHIQKQKPSCRPLITKPSGGVAIKQAFLPNERAKCTINTQVELMQIGRAGKAKRKTCDTEKGKITFSDKTDSDQRLLLQKAMTED